MPRHPPEKLKPCGTKAAYQRHIRAGLRGDAIDQACRRANNLHTIGTRRKNDNDTVYAAAFWRASKELRRRHPQEFEFLMEHFTREVRKSR